VIERLSAESFNLTVNYYLENGWEREGEMIVLVVGKERKLRYIQSMKLRSGIAQRG